MIGRSAGEGAEPLLSGPLQQPFPPRRLRAMTVSPSDPDFFIWSGRTQFDLIGSMVAEAGDDVSELGAVLDFGCGCGRIARWWAEVEGPELHGCDYDPELAAWCRANLRMEVSRNALEPPLPYEDESFDLVYALSIFTHMPPELERRWVAELTRVLSPGGFLWLTVSGEAHLDRLSPRDREAFARGDQVTQFADLPGTNLCAAFHPGSYVRGQMLGELDVVASALGSPDGAAPTYSQDAYLALKPGRRPRKRRSIPSAGGSYAERIDAERRTYAEQEEVHDLPPIFHHWTATYLKPMLDGLGFSNSDELFALGFERAGRDAPDGKLRFASLGAGNCDTEIRVAKLLIERGVTDFELECFDLNEEMLERGRAAARSASVGAKVLPRRADLNQWEPEHPYDGVMANQSLHHLVGLERVFDEVRRSLPEHGRFVSADMIGRNGHLRWPEALAIVREFWDELPASYRYNVQLGRQEDEFQDWDCSQGGGFEGIRAQEILPLLLERFGFELFIGFANAIDPFIDRSFGPHFDPDGEWDRDFIRRVHERDEAELLAGRLSPTHMLAIMRPSPYDGETAHRAALTPEFCLREERA